MSLPATIDIRPVPHPHAGVARAGFPLDHAYVERCWLPVAGPSVVAVLRQLPLRWERGETTLVTHELASSLGIAPSRLAGTLSRLAQFGLGRWSEAPSALEVFTTAPAVPERLLGRLPPWTRGAHARLLDEHLEHLAAGYAPARPGPVPDALHTRLAGHRGRGPVLGGR